jgi:hypothetical protein
MKIIASEEQIAAEIQHRIAVSTFANGYCAKCTAPKPYRIKHDGCANWSVDIPPAELRGCEGFVLSIVASVRRDYDLRPIRRPKSSGTSIGALINRSNAAPWDAVAVAKAGSICYPVFLKPVLSPIELPKGYKPVGRRR